jgi:hypothetical protein
MDCIGVGKISGKTAVGKRHDDDTRDYELTLATQSQTPMKYTVTS